MPTHEQILDYLDKAHPDATREERALHVLMLAILGNAPESLRLKEPKGTYTKGDMVLSDAIGLFLAMEGHRVQMSRVMGCNEPAEFVGLKWAQANPVMTMACCPSLLLIVRRLPQALAELLKLQSQPTYRTGDVIRHIPSGEEWLVATADARHVSPCGWPYGLARLDEVELVEAATDEAHLKLLQELANMSVPDPRRSYAQDVLAKMAGTPPA